MASEEAQIARLKELGNEQFRNGELSKALDTYTQAIKLSAEKSQERAVLYKNRAAVELKLSDYKAAEASASAALEIVPNDSKALFRRCQARENLGQLAEAFKDAKFALSLEPNNKVFVQTLRGFNVLIQEKQKDANSTESRVKQMFSFAFDPTTEAEKRLNAMNNILVLAREQAGANLIWESDGVKKILEVINNDANDSELVLSGYRILDELARDEQRALKLCNTITVEAVVWLMNKNKKEITDASSLLVQRCFNALSGMDRKENKKADPDKCERNKIVMVDLIFELKRMLVDPKVFAVARDNAIDTILKNLMHMDCGLPRGWSWRFVETDGLWRLLTVATCIPERTTLPITKDTREHLAVCLTRLYDDMVFDQYRDKYRMECERFVKEKMEKQNENRVDICNVITVLLMGPFDVGFPILGNSGITDMMLDMAHSNDEIDQIVAAEAIVHTASKRERCSAIISQGIPILTHLFKSKNDHIKARALVGLCKCASSHGSDISLKQMADGSNLKLAESCKKFLLNPSRDADLRRWAAEGLAYLSIDADVKEWLVEDPAAIRALVELAKQSGAISLFGVATIFVNLTNQYDKPKADPELVKLAQFAKHHVPEEHVKDGEEFIDKRTNLLVKEGATSACVALGKTESLQSRELLSRALFAFTKNKDNRGTVVQEGGSKILIQFANQGTGAGRTFASNALAKIGITINPEIAFPGQRAYEVIKPLFLLLDVENDGLQNYEALLALTNIGAMSESVRKRIMKENCLPKLEEYWFMQDHDQLRAAAAECILNLIHGKEAQDAIIKPGTDRLKLWVLYCGEEDERLVKAATAALALLTEHEEACRRIVEEVKSWPDILKEVAMAENVMIQKRALMAIHNMMSSCYDVAARMMQTDLFEVLMAVSKMDDKKRKVAQEYAVKAMQQAEKFELIKPTDREIYERTTGQKTVALQ